MNEPTASLAVTIGERIRTERLQRRWTLDQLAGASGISRRQLVNVEQGEANPSIGTLLSLSDALGIGLPALVEPAHTSAVQVTRAGAGAELWTGTAGGRGVLLAGTHPPDVVELWEWSMHPGERHDSAPHSAGTRELLHVRSGTVELTVADDTFTLSVGEAASFRGDLSHAYAAGADEPTTFSLAVFEPGVGQRDTPDNGAVAPRTAV